METKERNLINSNDSLSSMMVAKNKSIMYLSMNLFTFET